MKIMSFDPGNSTGILLYDSEKETYIGKCIVEDLLAIVTEIEDFAPDLIVYETFQLYPGKARSMAWNKFYPCEVIGVIKVTASRLGIDIKEQPASIKPFSCLDEHCPKGNDHIKDAYRHLWYHQHHISKRKKK